MRDLKNQLREAICLAPAARNASVAAPTGVDVKDADGLMILLVAGAITDGTHTVSVEHSDDGTSWSAVSADLLQGSFTALTSAAGGNAVQKVGYLGNKRHVRTPVTVAGATTGGVYSTVLVKGHLRRMP